MTGSRSYTRRRFFNAEPPASTGCQTAHDTQHDSHRFSSRSKTVPLRKGATFHYSTSPSTNDDDPILNIPFLPRRSPTCPKALEDAVAAGEKRVAHLLGVVDRSLSGLEKFSTSTQEILQAEDLPLPRFMLDAHVGGLDNMDIDPPSNQNANSRDPHRKLQKHHASDSGIGSTETSLEISREKAGLNGNQSSGVCAIRSGINGSSVSLVTSEYGSPHVLSEYACRQFQKHIILPIIRESSLKDFHPLVAGIPHRVGRKEITCLRDLEKVLLWLAPKWSVSKASFIQFCETSIQCIYTAVDYLNEPDQRRAADRPYTNGYFLDLTEQVRQYAEMITASRECLAAGRKPSNEYSQNESLSLHGGLSQTGQPAQLVRIKNGKLISLCTGKEMDPESSMEQRLRRSMSIELDHDIERSMARRRKAEQAAMKEHQKCKECDKVFRRPCDLTKHEKTHSRPWKCNESNCKYHQFGWPTEKERDRHVNDKHSVTPSLYKCQYHPCPYESKRESNCKQHMEKAHGWAYIRSKNNGKAGKKVPTAKAPITPPAASPEPYILNAASLDLSAVSGYLNPHDGNRVAHSVDGSVAATEDSANYLISGIPFTRGDVNHRPLDPYFSLDDTYADLASPGRSDHLFNTDQSSWDEIPVTNAQTSPSAFEASLTLQDPDILFSENFDWSNLNSDFTSYNMQLITPASSVDTRPRDSFSRNPSFSQEKLPDFQVTSLSPGAQDVMLYSPYSNDDGSKDEGYDDFISETGNPESDFALFDCSGRPAASYMCTLDKRHMFQDLATLVPSAWSGRGTDLAQQLGINELMQIDDD